MTEWKDFVEAIKSCASIFSYPAAEYKYTPEDVRKCASFLNSDIEAWLAFCSESGIVLHGNLSEAPLLKKIQYLASCRKSHLGSD